MLKIFKYLRYKHLLKNLLIFLPVFFDFENLNISQIKLLLIAFIGFSLLTNAIYYLNDYTDFKIDKYNFLKKKIILKKEYLLLTACLFFLLLLIYLYIFDYTFNRYIFLYLANFLIYNYYLKKIFFVDLIILSNFYIIRVLYGFALYEELDLSILFLIFIYLFFFTLAICKRLIQIDVNLLRKTNNLIPYYKKYKPLLKNFANITLSSSIIIYSLFIFYSITNTYIFENIFIQNKAFNKFSYSLITTLYIYLVFILYKVINIRTPKKDIFEFIIKDKFTIILLLSIIIYHMNIILNLYA